MPKMVLKQSFVSINSNDLSAYCSKIELAIQVEEKDVTTFASLGWKELLGGLGSAGLSLTFLNDVAASAIESIIWPLFGLVETFETRTSNAVRGTSNPSWTGSVLLSKWNGISGSVGDVNTADVQWPSSGLVSRLTS